MFISKIVDIVDGPYNDTSCSNGSLVMVLILMVLVGMVLKPVCSDCSYSWSFFLLVRVLVVVVLILMVLVVMVLVVLVLIVRVLILIVWSL